MKCIALSRKALCNTPAYVSINTNHLLISISCPKDPVDIPSSQYCKGLLRLQFDDVQDLDTQKYTVFNSDMARRVLQFVDDYCSQAQAIVCQCDAGISRSVAVASALSKIINHHDDEVFSSGIPNMLVYNTILEEFFIEKDPRKKWPSIFYLRERAMKLSLDIVTNRIWNKKVDDRIKGE